MYISNIDKICIFARVSTSIQDSDRQVNELTALSQRNGWSVEAVFCEKVSGAKKNTERNELSRMVEFVQQHNINKVVVTELCRLGRDTLQVLEMIEQFNKLGISLFILNYGIETLTESGETEDLLYRKMIAEVVADRDANSTTSEHLNDQLTQMHKALQEAEHDLSNEKKYIADFIAMSCKLGTL